MTASVFDDRPCHLGEGPLWHPVRNQLYWFDILGKRLLTRDADGQADHWQFDRHVSAAGWLDADSLLIASETDLFRFDLETGASETVAPLEDDNPVTRSNDGRADPYGGFWIGTMGKAAEDAAGAIYRYYRGEVRRLYQPITIPNAICFAPDGTLAYFADSMPGRVWRQRLDGQGWPEGEPELFLDHGPGDPSPDGAVVDADGRFWNAEWGASRVAVYDAGGVLVEEIPMPALQPSCPEFGGVDLSILFVTTAVQGIEDNASPHDGLTYTVDTDATGQAEHQVLL